MPSLLVTNDFPPKTGGIQSYLYELWRRLPPAETTVLTTPFDGDGAFDAAQPYRVERVREKMLLPTATLTRRIEALAGEVGATVVFVDPMLPLGWLAPRLRAARYVVVTHGAEITVPGRLPGTAHLARRVLRGAAGIVAAGSYPAREAARAARAPLRGVVIPPGVDTDRFRPLTPEGRVRARTRFGLDPSRPVVLGVSRLVPRKGFDVLIDAVAGLEPTVQLVVAGAGRDRRRLEARAQRSGVAPRTHFLGRVPDSTLPELYACADVFATPCRERWGGLEAEGFGIVFLEAAAAGVPAVAGRSGGSHEAVVDGKTGLVVAPRDVPALREALGRLLADGGVRAAMGEAARRRAERHFSYDRLAERLAPLAAGDLGSLVDLDRR
ncbi:MAG TPA: glycosyltransferase family 4 protein [Acidimicrobiia bacterium]